MTKATSQQVYTPEQLKAGTHAEAMSLAADILEMKHVGESKRPTLAVSLLARFLMGVVLNSEQLREEYSEDSSRLIDHIRNKFNVPVQSSRKPVYYQMRLDEILRFLNPDLRKIQDRNLQNYNTAKRFRMFARGFRKICNELKLPIPGFVNTVIATELPRPQEGRSDHPDYLAIIRAAYILDFPAVDDETQPEPDTETAPATS